MKYHGKQAATGKQYVFIFYLNPDKQTILIKQQMELTIKQRSGRSE